MSEKGTLVEERRLQTDAEGEKASSDARESPLFDDESEDLEGVSPGERHGIGEAAKPAADTGGDLGDGKEAVSKLKKKKKGKKKKGKADNRKSKSENPFDYKKVQSATDGLNDVYRDGVAVAHELKGAYDDIKKLMDFEGLFGKL